MMEESFGMLLRGWRERAEKSMGDVARYLGVSVSYVSDVERGLRAPLTAEKIIKVARFLDIPLRHTEELLKAAAKSRGAFEVNAGISTTHDEVGAALMRGWSSLSQEQLESIKNIVGRPKTGEHPVYMGVPMKESA